VQTLKEELPGEKALETEEGSAKRRTKTARFSKEKTRMWGANGKGRGERVYPRRVFEKEIPKCSRAGGQKTGTAR